MAPMACWLATTASRTLVSRPAYHKNVSDYATVTGTRVPVVVAFLDELNVLLTEAPKDIRHVADNLKTLVQLVRGAGYNVFGGSQYLTSEISPPRNDQAVHQPRAAGRLRWHRRACPVWERADKAIRAYADGTPGRGLSERSARRSQCPFRCCGVRSTISSTRSAPGHRSGAPPARHRFGLLRRALRSALQRHWKTIERRFGRGRHGAPMPVRRQLRWRRRRS